MAQGATRRRITRSHWFDYGDKSQSALGELELWVKSTISQTKIEVLGIFEIWADRKSSINDGFLRVSREE